MFELKVEEEIQGSSIWVKWCLDKETKEIMEKRAYGKSRLLLVITGGNESKEYRVLAPLENVVAILPARYPGKNTVFAAIVWDKTVREIKRTYLLRDNEGSLQYYRRVLDYSDEEEKDEGPAFTQFWQDGVIKGPIIEIDIPKEIFAEEPSEFEKKWVNLIFRKPVLNQCEFRKRRIIAYTIQPLVCLILAGVIILMLSTVSIFVLLAGFYEFNFEGVPVERVSIFDGRGQNYWALAWRKLFHYRPKKEDKNKAKDIESMEQQRLARIKRIYESASCRTGTAPTPPTRQRISLLYHDLKDKVCKPFAG